VGRKTIIVTPFFERLQRIIVNVYHS